jgi:hypothetical protein
MIHRQALNDQQIAFEQELARHRLFNQDQALRLNYERTRLNAELQAARMGLNKVWWPVWVVKKGWWLGSTVIQNARQLLR